MKRIIVLTTLLFILISVSAQKKLEPGKLVYTRWGGFWHSGTIVDVKKDKYLVHSTGYGPGYDRWVEKKDILLEKPKTKTKPLIASKPSTTVDTTINKPATETTKTAVPDVPVDKSEKSEPVKSNSVETVATVKTPVENPKPVPPVVSIDKIEKQELNNQSSGNAVNTSAVTENQTATKELPQSTNKSKVYVKANDPIFQQKPKPPLNDTEKLAIAANATSASTTTEAAKPVTENKTDLNKSSVSASSSTNAADLTNKEDPSANSSKQTVKTEPLATETKKPSYDSKDTWRTKESSTVTATNKSPQLRF